MSVEIQTRVWKTSKQKGSPLLLLLALADCANDEGVSWYGLEKLSKKTRLTRRQTINLIKALGSTRELHVARGMGPHGVNLYFVTTDMPFADLVVSLRKHLGISGDDAIALAKSILARGEKFSRVKNRAEKMQKISPDPLLDPSSQDSITDVIESSATFDDELDAEVESKVLKSAKASSATNRLSSKDSEEPPSKVPQKVSPGKKPKADVPPPDEGVLDAICWMLYGTQAAFKMNAKIIRKVYNELASAYGHITLESLRKYWTWWSDPFANWRGKNNQRPTWLQLKEFWSTAQAFKKGQTDANPTEGQLGASQPYNDYSDVKSARIPGR